jgi:hypothetical protein
VRWDGLDGLLLFRKWYEYLVWKRSVGFENDLRRYSSKGILCTLYSVGGVRM